MNPVAWPTQKEIFTAKILGHEPKRGECSCDFKVKQPSSVLPSTQVANHIWTVIHEAKKAQAATMGEEICQPCKGTGIDPFHFEERTCPYCDGMRTISTIPREQYLSLARDKGHEPIMGGCVCGQEDIDWDAHARQVAAGILQELVEFEESLRG